MRFENLPQIPGHAWRAMRLDDAAALHRFEVACSELDGATRVRSQTDWQKMLADETRATADSVVAINEDGEVAAAGWIDYDAAVHQVRAFLDGRVHPDFRGQGVGASLLSWLEERARAHMASIAGERPQVLRILFYDRGADAIELFEQSGFEFQFSEEVMGRDLRVPMPEYPLPAGMSFHTWRPDNAGEFFLVYDDAFRTRPGAHLSEPAWRHHFTDEDDPEFRPGLSLLVTDGDEPIAYAVCHSDVVGDGETAAEAWITQTGVRTAWRRRGIASALLVEAMRRFVAAGHSRAMLSVNVNNPQARRLYERLGFKLERRFTMYYKKI
jgi:mycothiol synthase